MCSDIHEEIVNLDDLEFLLRAGQVVRFRPDESCDRTLAAPENESLCGQALFRDPAHAGDPHKTVGIDLANDESHFIHVGKYHHLGPGRILARLQSNDVSQAIHLYVG